MKTKFIPALMLVALVLPFVAACATQSGVEEIDEATLEASVRTAIAGVSSEATEVGVKVDGGTITLSGTVGSSEERTKIVNAARDVNGVRSVINNMTIR